MTTEEADVLQGYRFIFIKESPSGISVRYVDDLRANVHEDDPAVHDDDAFAMILLDMLSLLGEEMTLNVIAKDAGDKSLMTAPDFMLRTLADLRSLPDTWRAAPLNERAEALRWIDDVDDEDSLEWWLAHYLVSHITYEEKCAVREELEEAGV